MHITCSGECRKKARSLPIGLLSIHFNFLTMQRIQRLISTAHCFRRTPASLWCQVNPAVQPSTTYSTALRFYASGAAKGNSKKSSPFKFSHPDSKSKNAVLSPSSLATGVAPAAPAATVAARESASKIRKTAGSATNFSRTLAEMCAKQYVQIISPYKVFRVVVARDMDR